MTYQEEVIYNSAMKCVNELADDIIQECCEMAEYNNYEIDWVLKQFRTCFNQKVIKLLNENS